MIVFLAFHKKRQSAVGCVFVQGNETGRPSSQCGLKIRFDALVSVELC